MNPYGLLHSILSRTRIPIPPLELRVIISPKSDFCYNRGMNILYCGDEGISRGVLVSILSLLMNGRRKYDGNKMAEDESAVVPVYNIYIMTIRYEGMKPFKKETAEFLDRLVKGKEAESTDMVLRNTNAKNFVKLIDATEVFLKNLPAKNMGTYFTPGAMLRLYIDKVPELAELKRLLYLDFDVVCRGDLREFYETDLLGAEVAGVLDIYGRRWYKYHGIFKRKEGLRDWADATEIQVKKSAWLEKPAWTDQMEITLADRPRSFLKQDYMNSGVLLFNLEECRRTGMFERAAEICANKRMLLPDQGALNRAITRRKLMPRRFNEQGERPLSDTVLHHFSNNFKFWPYFRVQKVKPYEVEKIHEILKIREYDDILEKYLKIRDRLGRG